MYCTTFTDSESNDWGSDVGHAYRRFRRKAQTLGSISRLFHVTALDVTAAYYAALTQPAPQAWAMLVTRTATLIERTHALPAAFVLDAQERRALAFFEEIVRENADLLAAHQAQRLRIHEAQSTQYLKRHTRCAARISV